MSLWLCSSAAEPSRHTHTSHHKICAHVSTALAQYTAYPNTVHLPIVVCYGINKQLGMYEVIAKYSANKGSLKSEALDVESTMKKFYFCEPPHTVTWQPSCAIFIHCLFIEQMSFVAPFSNSLFIQRKETIAAISRALWWLLMANWRQESKWIGLYVHEILTMASPTLS